MPDYALPMYDQYRTWIRKARDNGNTWDDIAFACQQTEEGLEDFLAFQTDNNWWVINSSEWKDIVRLQEEAEKESKQRERAHIDAFIVGPGQDNALYVPTDSRSSWQLYRQHMLDYGFSNDTIDRIEQKTIRILRRLNYDDHENSVKGLVVGNVQSGKTANMAALMAMAADWGWNMFIILSGTIEALRRQTQKRLLKDLNQPGNIAWVGLEHLSKHVSLEQQSQYLSFEDGSKQRYFNVCLKVSARLKNLLEWLQHDAKKMHQMRVLIIDDEADQAGINTANIDAGERTKVNRSIVNLVQSKTHAMNYIGYTATPYANILNESSRESLYPSDFIATLDMSNEYFGPQQIFGAEGFGDEIRSLDGLGIIRTLQVSPKDELAEILAIHHGQSTCIPDSFNDAICWFLCCVATFRVWDMRKPVSMLLHTSQFQEHHRYIAVSIQKWFDSHTADQVIEMCRAIWKRETALFDKARLFEQYPTYGHLSSEICEYPDFKQLEPHISTLCKSPKHIKLDDDQELSYHDGVHLCIDNSNNTRLSDDGEHIRLAYPETEEIQKISPAFIVIGGATLSRGLTIEGLVSTCFLRSVSQADTLMQMGRWFGYRKKYELLPRIWMTEKTRKQFVFLSTLDLELREEIHDMEAKNLSPRDYAPRLLNTPKASFIRITAKKRMQSAVEAEFDYTGVMSQTTLFDESKEILEHNISLTRAFLDGLPAPRADIDNPYNDQGYIWTGIPFSTIYNGLLKVFNFQQRSRAFTNMEALAEWINKMTASGNLDAWNIRLAGLKFKSEQNLFNFRYGEVSKVNRSRKNKTEVDGLIDIGVLRDPKDLVADIDCRNVSEILRNRLDNFHASEIRIIRHEAGMDTTPLLVVYCIDKNSKHRSTDSGSLRDDLNAPSDIIGLCLCIPGGKPNSNYVTKIKVKIENDLLDSTSETED